MYQTVDGLQSTIINHRGSKVDRKFASWVVNRGFSSVWSSQSPKKARKICSRGTNDRFNSAATLDCHGEHGMSLSHII